MTKRIIDVSEFNGTINWSIVKSKIDGAIIRCGYGDNIAEQDDKQYERNISECERLGIPVGIYLYSYATTVKQAESELAHILRLAKGHILKYPVYLDCEQKGTESFAPTACRIVCDGVKAKGYIPGVYSNLSWWNNYLDNVNGYSRWVAQWGAVCTYQKSYDIWQYSSSGQLDGITGAVDLDYCYKDFAGTPAEIKYQVYTDKSGWLPTVKNLEDYAGKDGEAIKGMRVLFDDDTLIVETHQLEGGSIDKLTMYAYKYSVRYRVRTIGSNDYLAWMENKIDTSGGSDTYAGIAGKAIDRVQITVKAKKVN